MTAKLAEPDVTSNTQRWSNQTSLALLGVDADTLRSLKDRTSAETFTTAFMDTPDGDPIVGLAFQTDYDASQEHGIGEVRRALTGADPRRFCITENGMRHVCVFDDDRGMVLSSEALRDQQIAWGDELVHLHYGVGRTTYIEQWDRQIPHVRSSWHKLDRLTFTELKDTARQLGIRPLPRSRAALITAIDTHPDHVGQLPDIWPAPFVFGRDLVLRATGDSLAARVLRKLVDAARSGTLGMGSASGPFHTGSLFYDTRDETAGLIAARKAAHDWHDACMAELEPVADELRRRGHRWFFLGNPRTINGQLKFWLNGMALQRRQPYGWYTLEELRAEKFVADANARD